MDKCFSSISLLHASKKLDNFFTIIFRTESLQQTKFLFVALSRCNTQNFCLSHWVTATNEISICYQKVPKKNKKCPQKCKKRHKVPKSAKKRPKVPNSWLLLALLATFWQCIQILFVSVTQCNNFFVVCCSNSVRQTKYMFVTVTQCDKKYWPKISIYEWHVTKELKKNPKKNILPNLNFTSAIKLLWGTLLVESS